jgi:hypothetical protein
MNARQPPLPPPPPLPAAKITAARIWLYRSRAWEHDGFLVTRSTRQAVAMMIDPAFEIVEFRAVRP